MKITKSLNYIGNIDLVISTLQKPANKRKKIDIMNLA